MREVSFAKINSYFKEMVSKSTVIKDYIGISNMEINNKLVSGKYRLEDPFLVLYEYSGKLKGNQQRTLGSRDISFCILFRCKPGDFSGQEKAIDLAEIYGLEILSRIRWDSTTHQYNWLSAFFPKDNISFSTVEYEFANGLFGMEFSFELETIDSLSLNPQLWNDEKDLCAFQKNV